MPDATPQRSFFTRFSTTVYRARFAMPSLLIHLVLLLIFGSVVVVKQVFNPPDFEAGDGTLVGDDTAAAAPPQDAPSLDTLPTVEPVATPVTAAATMDVLTSSSVTQTSFSMPVNAARAVSPNASDMNGVAQSIAKAGKGLGSGMAGGTMRFFGSKEKSQNALIGTFYDLKQTRRKKPTNISPDEYHRIFRRFVKENWRESILDDYFAAPEPLYTTQIMIPNMSADEGPKAFSMQKEVQPSRWLVHYRGKVSPPEDGTYSFVGAGDDVMVVRFNGKVVLDRCWYQQDQEWQPSKNYDYGWTGIPNGFAKGDAVHVRAGQWYDIEVLIGEQPGGLVFACLLMEKEGETYEKDGRGNPILPVFRLADIPMPELQSGQTLPPYQQNGPVWRAQNMKSGSGSMLEQFFGKK